MSGSEVRDSNGAGSRRHRLYHAGRPELECKGGDLKHRAPSTGTRPATAATEIIHQSRGVRKEVRIGGGRRGGGPHQVSGGHGIRDALALCCSR